MPKFNVRKSIIIDAPIEKVYASVRDFKEWKVWSPWLIAEPGCRLNYAPDGRSYSWEGSIVGAGENGIIAEDKPESIDFRLVFHKPWKSVAAVRFELKVRPEGVVATWSMESSIPFFLFWMKNKMAAFIGMDYRRGLEMLKDYVEKGSVPSKLEFKGIQDFPGFQYVGVRAECSCNNIGDTMQRTMEKVRSLMKEHGIEAAGNDFSAYHKYDPAKNLVIFTTGYPVAVLPSELPEGLLAGKLPASSVYSVEHTGAYRHLGNAWSAANMHARAKVFRQNNKIACFEIYANNPADTPEDELVTIVHLPAK